MLLVNNIFLFETCLYFFGKKSKKYSIIECHPFDEKKTSFGEILGNNVQNSMYLRRVHTHLMHRFLKSWQKCRRISPKLSKLKFGRTLAELDQC